MSLYNIFLNFSHTCIFSSSMQLEPAGNIDSILMTKTQMKFQTSFASDYIIFFVCFFIAPPSILFHTSYHQKKHLNYRRFRGQCLLQLKLHPTLRKFQFVFSQFHSFFSESFFSLRILFGDLLLNLDIGFNFRISILVFLEDCGDSSQSSILFLKFFNLTPSEQAGYSK